MTLPENIFYCPFWRGIVELVFKAMFEKGHVLSFGVVLALVIIFMREGLLGTLTLALRQFRVGTGLEASGGKGDDGR